MKTKTLEEVYDEAYEHAHTHGHTMLGANRAGLKAVNDYGKPKLTIPTFDLESIYDEAALSVNDGNPMLEHKRGLEAVATAVAHATVEMVEGKQ